ncbi:tetratricopeptide repeat protein [bacterium]|nr:tetratricopeptide repeat protein [bacterium]
MKYWRGIGVALLAAGLAAPAVANTRSQQLDAKGLVPFQAKRWQEAQPIFSAALQADPDDAVAAYYLGLTEARLGNRPNAIRDIERALALDPTLKPALLDLGILYFDSGQYPAAQQWLERAYQQPDSRFSAALYLGITRLRLGDPAGALAYLREAQKDPALRQTGQYYEAVALLRDGQTGPGKTLLQEVQAGPGDLQTTQVARQALAGGGAMAVAAGAEKPWSVHANAGFGYDSNNGLVPSSSAAQVGLDTAGEMDGFFRVGAGGSYTVADADIGSAEMGYNIYQSVHFSTPRFDLQSHRLNLTLATPLRNGFWQAGVAGIYDFYLLDYQSFYQAGRGTPFVNFYQGDIGATQIFYTFGGQDFFRGPFNPFRDSYINRVGARQMFLLGAVDRFLSLGYTWDNFDPLSRNGTDFAYTDNMFDAAIDFPILDYAQGQVGYLFDLQNYEHPNSRVDYSKRRHDGQNQVVVHLTHAFTEMISADLAYLGVFNHSNISDFEYDRQIIQANVWLQF